MSLSRSRLLRLLAALFALLLVAGACGGDDDDDATDDDDTEEAEDQTEAEEETDDETDETDSTDGDGDTETVGGEEREEAISEFADSMAADAGVDTGASAYTYSEVTDATGSLTVAIPDQWVDFDPDPPLGTYGAALDFGPLLVSSPDLDAFIEGYTVPGMAFTATSASTTQSTQAVLEALAADVNVSGCETVTPPEPYSDPLYTGQSQLYTDCGDASFIWIAVEDVEQSFIAVVGVQLLTDADIEALETIIGTFRVNI